MSPAGHSSTWKTNHCNSKKPFKTTIITAKKNVAGRPQQHRIHIWNNKTEKLLCTWKTHNHDGAETAGGGRMGEEGRGRERGRSLASFSSQIRIEIIVISNNSNSKSCHCNINNSNCRLPSSPRSPLLWESTTIGT